MGAGFVELGVGVCRVGLLLRISRRMKKVIDPLLQRNLPIRLPQVHLRARWATAVWCGFRPMVPRAHDECVG